MAGGVLTQLRILLGLDPSGVRTGAGVAKGELRGVQTEARRTNQAMTDLRRGFAAGLGIGGGTVGFLAATRAASALTDALGDTVKAASALEESQAKVGVVFGDSSREVEAWAAASSRAFGQSTQQALEAAGTYGNLFQAFGLTRDAASDMSTSLVELASDLASFNNTSVDDALVALRSGLSGETEPLKRYGIALNDARMRAELTAQGVRDLGGTLTAAQKATAAYAIIMKDSSLAQGDFARTSDGLANSSRILDAELANLSAEIGTLLVPALTETAQVVVRDVIPALRKAAELADQLMDSLPFVGLARDAQDAEKEVRALAARVREFGALAETQEALEFALINAALDDLQRQFSAGEITAEQYRKASEGVTQAVRDQIAAVDTAKAAWLAHERGQTEAAAATAKAEAALASLGKLMPDASNDMRRLGEDARDAGKDFADFAEDVRRATGDLGKFMGAAQGGPEGVRRGGEFQPPPMGGVMDTPAVTEAQQEAAERRAEEARRERERLAAEAQREREQKAAEAERERERKAAEDARREAQRRQWQMEDLFESATKAAREHFDFVHQANLDAIQGIRDRRNAELDAQAAIVQGAVDAERQRIDAMRDRERENELRAAVADAETPEDLIRAQRDLNRFLEDQRLDRLQANADAEKARIEAEKANNNAVADLAVANENERARAEQEAFDEEFRRLQKHLSRHPEEWAKVQAEVLKLMRGTVPDFAEVGREQADAYAKAVLGRLPNGGVSASAGLFVGLQQPPVIVHVFLDSEQITDAVDRRMATRQSIYDPIPVSTGSRR